MSLNETDVTTALRVLADVEAMLKKLSSEIDMLDIKPRRVGMHPKVLEVIGACQDIADLVTAPKPEGTNLVAEHDPLKDPS